MYIYTHRFVLFYRVLRSVDITVNCTLCYASYNVVLCFNMFSVGCISHVTRLIGYIHTETSLCPISVSLGISLYFCYVACLIGKCVKSCFLNLILQIYHLATVDHFFHIIYKLSHQTTSWYNPIPLTFVLRFNPQNPFCHWFSLVIHGCFRHPP